MPSVRHCLNAAHVCIVMVHTPDAEEKIFCMYGAALTRPTVGLLIACSILTLFFKYYGRPSAGQFPAVLFKALYVACALHVVLKAVHGGSPVASFLQACSGTCLNHVQAEITGSAVCGSSLKGTCF